MFGDVKDAKRRQRCSAAIGRILNRLHVRALVKKVPPLSALALLTKRGRRILGDTLATYRRYSAQAA